MASWQALGDEAARWHDAGRAADLWWRDDDAVDEGAALDRLMQVQRESAMPLSLAVVPARATPALGDRLRQERAVDVLQHGYAHVNHASPYEKKIELGPQRPAMVVLGELGTGWLALERLFAGRALAVMVPPWNRIGPGLVPTLPEIGFNGLSIFGPRRRAHPVRGLTEINTHVDLVDWRERRFAGDAAVLAALVGALARARTISAEPVGVLSHHLAMDAKAWNFLRSLWQKALIMPGLRPRPARELFAVERLAGGEGTG
jgi:hypothetical protein